MENKKRSTPSKKGEKREIEKEITFNIYEWEVIQELCPPGVALRSWMRSVLLREKKFYETSKAIECRFLGIQIANMSRALTLLARSISDCENGLTQIERIQLFETMATINERVLQISDDTKIL